MIVDLAQATAADGLRLDGVIHSPPRPLHAPAKGDVILCIHGTGSNFYSSTLFQKLTPNWLEIGLTVAWVNTRGHDGVSISATAQGRRRQGAAFESFRESPLDLWAWCDALVARGHSRILLLGHSSGAIKSMYTMAARPHPSVTGIVALSPPRLSYANFLASPKRDEFLEIVRRAEMLVAAKEPSALLDVTFPLPYLISAAGYLEKYGPAEEYDLLKLLPAVRVSTLLTFGSIEVAKEVAFHRVPEAIAALKVSGDNIDVHVVDGADHVYTGVMDKLAPVITPWLTSG